MKKVLTATFLIAAAGLLAPTGPVPGACERVKTEDGHTVITGNCTLEAEAEWAEAIEEIVSVPLIRTWPPAGLGAAIQLPDLRVADIRNTYSPVDRGREIHAVITNDGPADVTGPFVVRGGLAITDACRTGMYHNGTIVNFSPALETVNRLDAGDTVEIGLFNRIYLPNSYEDFDMYPSAFVDGDSSLSGGSVHETDEMDNRVGEHCRLFQADPDKAARHRFRRRVTADKRGLEAAAVAVAIRPSR